MSLLVCLLTYREGRYQWQGNQSRRLRKGNMQNFGQLCLLWHHHCPSSYYRRGWTGGDNFINGSYWIHTFTLIHPQSWWTNPFITVQLQTMEETQQVVLLAHTSPWHTPNLCVTAASVGQESTHRPNCTSSKIFGPLPLGSHVFGRTETETEIQTLFARPAIIWVDTWEREKSFPEGAAQQKVKRWSLLNIDVF